MRLTGKKNYYSEYTKKVYAQGVTLMLCGKPMTPSRLEEELCKRKHSYRARLVFDSEGNLTEVRYERLPLYGMLFANL